MGQIYVLSETGYAVHPDLIPSRSVLAFELRRNKPAAVPFHANGNAREIENRTRIFETKVIAEEILSTLRIAKASGQRMNVLEICSDRLRGVSRSRFRWVMNSLIRRGLVVMHGQRRAATYEVVDAHE